MEIKKTLEGKLLKVALLGRLDTNTAPELEAALMGEFANVDQIDLDFEELEYVSSAGLRVLLMAQKTLANKNGKLVIRHVRPEIMEVFDMTGFSSFLTIED